MLTEQLNFLGLIEPDVFKCLYGFCHAPNSALNWLAAALQNVSNEFWEISDWPDDDGVFIPVRRDAPPRLRSGIVPAICDEVEMKLAGCSALGNPKNVGDSGAFGCNQKGIEEFSFVRLVGGLDGERDEFYLIIFWRAPIVGTHAAPAWVGFVGGLCGGWRECIDGRVLIFIFGSQPVFQSGFEAQTGTARKDARRLYFLVLNQVCILRSMPFDDVF